jgi:uncharacterized protein YpmS
METSKGERRAWKAFKILLTINILGVIIVISFFAGSVLDKVNGGNRPSDDQSGPSKLEGQMETTIRLLDDIDKDLKAMKGERPKCP